MNVGNFVPWSYTLVTSSYRASVRRRLPEHLPESSTWPRKSTKLINLECPCALSSRCAPRMDMKDAEGIPHEPFFMCKRLAFYIRIAYQYKLQIIESPKVTTGGIPHIASGKPTMSLKCVRVSPTISRQPCLCWEDLTKLSLIIHVSQMPLSSRSKT